MKPNIEELSPRIVPVRPVVQVSLDNGILNIVGTRFSDSVDVQVGSDTVTVNVNGRCPYRLKFDAGKVTSFAFAGMGGRDTFRVINVPDPEVGVIQTTTTPLFPF